MKRFIYLISPNKIYPNFYKDLEKVLSSKKVSFFQLRLKKTPKNIIIKIAKKIKKITKKHNVKFIINDDSKLAKKVGVNPAIVAGRVRFERKSYRLLSQIVGTNSVQPFFMEGAKHM